VPQHIVFSGGLITEGLGLISPWLLPVALLIDAFLFEVTSQCAGDPPAMPTADALDIRNAIGGVFNPNFGAWITAVNNLLLNWAWDQYCTCAAGSPSVAVYPSAPTNTAAPQGSIQVPCYVGDVTRLVAQEPPGNFFAQPANAALWPNTGVIYQKLDPPRTYDYVTLSVTPLSGTLSVHATGLVVGQTYVTQMSYLDAAHNYLVPSGGGNFTAGAATEDHSWTFAVPAGAVFGHGEISLLGGGAPAGETVHATATWNCTSGAPGGPVSPCADSPEVLNLLAQIHRLLTAVYNRQTVPIGSYIEGAVHAGLVGNGTQLLVAACVGVKVTITADTSGQGQHAGNPTYLFNRGFIVPIAVEGPIRAPARLSYNPQLFQLPATTDAVGYTLTQGVTVSITELLPGP